MKAGIVILSFLSVCIVLEAQDKIALQYAERLDSMRMKATLTRLVSDEFAGRKSNEEGSLLAADYIIGQLKQNNIKEGNRDSYKQNIEAFHREKPVKYFRLDDFNYDDCYSYSNNTFQDSVISASDIVFAGYGLYHSTFNDFAGIDIKDKIVMVVEGDGPINKYGVRCHSASDVPNMKYIESQKPVAVLIVKPGFRTFSTYSSKSLHFYSNRDNESLPRARINELLANRILEPVDKTIKQLQYESESGCKSLSFEFNNEFVFNGDNSYRLADVSNIIGVIEGSDLKDEYVVLSAHYDHIGITHRGKIYYGADDNASGVSVVMEIARVMNEAEKAGKGPRRSVVILFPNAEEDGLYGSGYMLKNLFIPSKKQLPA
ncbi:MAG: M28 family peptidase [Bacteroidales bacterium]|nr:M28 family peptidase [Bacteroidales bacterium]